MEQPRIRIFISSVQREFAEERAMLCRYIRTDVLLGMYFDAFAFEEEPAQESTPQQVYLDGVDSCDIYLGIFGTLYGYEDAEGVSPTEREYDRATAQGKYRLAYVLNKGEETRHPKEAALIRKVEQDLVRQAFIDGEGLRNAVYASLIRYLERKGYMQRRPFDSTAIPEAGMKDLDASFMRNYIYMARAKRNFKLDVETPPEELLGKLGLRDSDGSLVNAAVLLFGREPQRFFPASEVKCAQFYGNVVEKPIPSYQIYHGNVFELADQATSFVMSRVDNWVGTRDSGETASVPTRPELPVDAVKEAIVNAICHRDYSCPASVQVMLFRNRLEVRNPGSLPVGLTPRKLETSHNSYPQNLRLAEAMYRNGYIEKMGTGTEDIIRKCREHGLRRPEFRQDGDFVVTIWRNEDESSVRQEDLSAMVAKMGMNPAISRAQLAKELGISLRQVIKLIDKLRDEGSLSREGSARGGRWVLKK